MLGSLIGLVKPKPNRWIAFGFARSCDWLDMVLLASLIGFVIALVLVFDSHSKTALWQWHQVIGRDGDGDNSQTYKYNYKEWLHIILMKEMSKPNYLNYY